MKKVLILVLSTILLLSMFSYAYCAVTEVPYAVAVKASSLGANNYAITENPDGTFTIFYTSGTIYYYSNEFNSHKNGLGNISWITTTSVNLDNWTAPQTAESYHSPKITRTIYATQDITDYYNDSGDSVFFSKLQALPLGVNPVTGALHSIVPNVVSSSSNILVPAVAILAIMVAVSLIPRVLYRL